VMAEAEGELRAAVITGKTFVGRTWAHYHFTIPVGARSLYEVRHRQ
jgi:hypothetical protein